MTIEVLFVECAMKRVYQAGEFKAHCLEIMNLVYQKHVEVTITKRKTPIVRLVPLEDKAPKLFGCMAKTGKITGDIIAPIEEEWDACH